MSITGAHVVCGYPQNYRGATIFVPLWSETIALGASTGQKAPTTLSADNSAMMVFRVRAPSSGEMMAAAGISPDPTLAVSSSADNVRQHFMASELLDIPALPGAKLAVVAA